MYGAIRQGFFMSIGSRLREERERIHLSQADFAEKSGVHRNTIVRYETDKTQLSAGFIETMRAVGIDVDYVLFGIPNPDVPVDCPFVQAQNFDLQYVFTLKHCRAKAAASSAYGSRIERLWQMACKECPKNPIKHGLPITQTPADIDGPLLLALLEGVEAALLKSGVTVVPAKKAQVVVILYRAFKTSGKVDQKMIEETIALAG
jgi:transcriptional regulator with XRE-family HTH domain